MSQGFYGFPRILDIVRATTFKALGKAGATNGAALAGGTASGAPVAPAGPFDVGDVIVDASGKLWICTTAGTSQSSPGSFTQVGGTTSPLTTKGDVWVYGSADARLGVGSDNQVLTADAAQSLGVKWAAAGAATGTTKVQLDYEPSTDIINGVTLTANTWVDLTANQSFTVDASTSVIEIAVNGMIMAGNTAAATQTGVRINVDSAGTPVTKTLCGAGYLSAGPGLNNYVNILAGTSPISLTGLSAGSHTVKLQAYGSPNASTAYCRPGGGPNVEFLSIRVLERK